MPSIIKAYEDGTLATLQAEERKAHPELFQREDVESYRPRQDFDEDMDEEPTCRHCDGWGFTNCFCGGDLCVCNYHGEKPCNHCGGY